MRETERSDRELIAATRDGDKDAYGILWERHRRAALAAATAITSAFDADDLVQEAFVSIYLAILRGKGPEAAFRPYLFAAIRNTAAKWGRKQREIPTDEVEDVPSSESADDEAERELDRSLTATAFRSLPARWQEVLWYVEVEGRKPAAIGAVLGMTANSVAQLSVRAREGLREAWVQAHLRTLSEDSECRWVVPRLAAFAREKTSRRDGIRIDAHLLDCPQCAAVLDEAGNVNRRLAFVLLPLVLGMSATAGYAAYGQVKTGSVSQPTGALSRGRDIVTSVAIGSKVALASLVAAAALAGGGLTALAIAPSGTDTSAVAVRSTDEHGSAEIAREPPANAAPDQESTSSDGSQPIAAPPPSTSDAAVSAPGAAATSSGPTTPAPPSAPAASVSSVPSRGTAPSTSPAPSESLSPAGAEDTDGAASGSQQGGADVEATPGHSTDQDGAGQFDEGTGTGSTAPSADTSTGDDASTGSGEGATAPDEATGGSPGQDNAAVTAPSFLSSAFWFAGPQLVVRVVVSGTPGATAVITTEGAVLTQLIASDGTAAFELHPTPSQILRDITVSVTESASGPPAVSAHLSSLIPGLR
ncbi:sigma-70 family RNA polymerase sigma factor [Microbacterium enclense]|uniref:sigma-70 family RNA polymerase sigma factor n=1 Tax=Microbacterium enclense TaxID=993073 RepID=UPI003F7E626F